MGDAVRAVGRLWGVGLGPGDPELVTLKAVRLIGAADVIAYHSARHGRSIARGVAEPYLRAGQIEEPLIYPVTTETTDHPGGYRGAIDEFYATCARRLAAHLDAGRDVVVLCEGDPLFYGSYMHLHKRLAHRYPAEVVPGVTSVSAASAALGRPLVEGEETLTVLPGTLPADVLADRLAAGGPAAVLKLGRTFGSVREALARSGRLAEAWYVERASTGRQRVAPLAEVDPAEVPYFSIAVLPSPAAQPASRPALARGAGVGVAVANGAPGQDPLVAAMRTKGEDGSVRDRRQAGYATSHRKTAENWSEAATVAAGGQATSRAAGEPRRVAAVEAPGGLDGRPRGAHDEAVGRPHGVPHDGAHGRPHGGADGGIDGGGVGEAGGGRGEVVVVGLGPGGRAWLTPEAQDALATADDLVGYGPYLDRVPPNPRQRRHASDNRVEAERAAHALELAAAGSRVAVVSSGDPGVFAMASAVLEVAGADRFAGVPVRVVPGLTAAQAVAARAGAPLGHDYCVVSLSDRLKPWEVIAGRLTAAARADLVLAIYNPASRARTWQVTAARDLLLEHRAPDTPVVIGRDAGRPGESLRVTTLAKLDPAHVDMRCLLIVGSSTTRVVERHGRPVVFTPRRYPA
ncbi:precorrin-2 C(20)-methyltransferase [Sphaerisporangium melleum]|nr:precorrin-2 C(20)-methyltransferase [Sphaerisporangium melleum]